MRQKRRGTGPRTPFREEREKEGSEQFPRNAKYTFSIHGGVLQTRMFQEMDPGSGFTKGRSVRVLRLSDPRAHMLIPKQVIKQTLPQKRNNITRTNQQKKPKRSLCEKCLPGGSFQVPCFARLHGCTGTGFKPFPSLAGQDQAQHGGTRIQAEIIADLILASRVWRGQGRPPKPPPLTARKPETA